MSHKGVPVLKMYKAAIALADVAGEVEAAHVLKQIVRRVYPDVAELAQRMLLLVPLQLVPREVAQLQGKHCVCLWHIQDA